MSGGMPPLLRIRRHVEHNGNYPEFLALSPLSCPLSAFPGTGDVLLILFIFVDNSA
jgi:hypothetical protein